MPDGTVIVRMPLTPSHVPLTPTRTPMLLTAQCLELWDKAWHSLGGADRVRLPRSRALLRQDAIEDLRLRIAVLDAAHITQSHMHTSCITHHKCIIHYTFIQRSSYKIPNACNTHACSIQHTPYTTHACKNDTCSIHATPMQRTCSIPAACC